MRTVLLAALVLLAPAAAAASDGLSSALAARSLLGPSIWARVVRIETAGPQGVFGGGAHPGAIYPLVFELSGILWFYEESSGTQSLSLRTGSLDADKAAPGPLFRAIDRRFTAWSWAPEATDSRARHSQTPPNACFIESVASLFQRLSAGGEARAPRLLSYYVDTPFGQRGHTVLVFGTRDGVSAVDPEISERPMKIPAYLARDPRTLSAYLRGGPIAGARTLAISSPSGPGLGSQLAMIPRNRDPAG